MVSTKKVTKKSTPVTNETEEQRQKRHFTIMDEFISRVHGVEDAITNVLSTVKQIGEDEPKLAILILFTLAKAADIVSGMRENAQKAKVLAALEDAADLANAPIL